MDYCFIFMLGCILASFINVVIYRLPLHIPIYKGRSFCPNCDHQLHAIDLIPIINFIYLKGRCRYCHHPISLKDPLIEILGSMLAVYYYDQYGFTYYFIFILLLSMILIAISVIDIDTMLIYDGLLICYLVLSVISTYFISVSLIDRIIGVFIISVPLYLMTLWKPNSFGGGDIKFITVSGFLLGYKHIIIVMYLAIMLGGLCSGILLLVKKVERKDHIPFAPFLSMAVMLVLLNYQQISNFYLML